MRFAPYVSAAIVALALTAGTASAGISDIVSDIDPAPVESLSSLTDPTDPMMIDATAPRLSLDAPPTTEPSDLGGPTHQNGIAPTAVTAPLPAALVPGACLLLGNFVLAKVIKRRLR